VDVVRFAPSAAARRRIRRELQIPDEACVVGTVGRLAAEKDQAALVLAMAPLLSAERRLVIVGDGAERGALEAQIAGIPQGRFISMLGDRRDVESILSALDVFALTSRTEGLPLVLLEAMASELPVVSTSVGGIPDLVTHGATGLLTRHGDGLTRLLQSVFDDRALARRLGEAGRREVVARYSVTTMAQKYERLYRNLLEDRRRFIRPGGGAALGQSA
jgi:glycosyltransferase involved in cell wall biosynthesis